MTNVPYHIPALLPQALEGLNIRPDGTYVDVTFGGGGHSKAILELLSPSGRLCAFDQDAEAIANAPADERLTMIHGNFRYLTNYLRFEGVEWVDGLLGDLGVSFHHFDAAERGFSFRADGPLDMRMNRSAAQSAAELLNTATTERLTDILRLYGELQDAPRIARAIDRARQAAPLVTVNDLLAVVSPLLNPKREKKDLACVFQALRIEVNDEMGALRSLLESTLQVTRPGSRLAIITYHSLEDRMVKNFMRSGNVEGREDVDFYGRRRTPWKLITSKPLTASAAEVEANPRSRSAKLRVAERIAITDHN